MSLEAEPTPPTSRTDRASPGVQELNRRFNRRCEIPTSPLTSQRSTTQGHTLPKVLSHISKAPSAVSNAEKTNHSITPPESNGVNQPESAHEGCPKAELESEDHHSTATLSTMSTEAAHKQTTSPEHLIGLELLQEQVRRLALRKGFTLNLMVVGRSGLGKSTLINTLFQSCVFVRGAGMDLTKPEKTTEVRSTKTVIQENGVRLDLTVTDTPGFGDRIDNTNCWDSAEHYINEQYEKYLLEEQSPTRNRWIRDTRVHCCLYFISPTGHRLRPLDLKVLQRLHKIVNIIPVIAKADSLTLEEREEFKNNIREDLALNQIETYPLAKFEHEEDFEINQSYRNMTPFAVIGSEKTYKAMGRLVLGRQNGWGLVQIENPMHCEFHHLRNLLIRNRMQDLIELTASVHYEAFRQKRLLETNENLLDISTLNESHI